MTARTKFVLNGFVFSLFFSGVLFVSAGRIDYVEGWIYSVTSLLTTALNVFTVAMDPELMKERSKPGEGTKSWDKIVLGLSGIVSISTLVVAGLDSGRYRWTPAKSWIINALGVFLMIAGQTVFLTARNQNKFFSTVVRIQKDRGHTVCETGLYRVVRHPGYLGMIISTTGFPFLLGSRWCWIPTVLATSLLCVRTFLEDKTLKDELDGYLQYTLKTRSRLVPGVW